MLKLLKFLMGIMLILASILAYSIFIEPNLLTAKHYSLQFDKIQGDSVRIVQFTDTHLGEFFNIEQLEKVVAKINDQKPDLVFFTGDLLDEADTYEGELEDISLALAQIEADHGKFAIYGNRDYGGGAEWIYERVMEDSGFTVLVNEQVKLTIHDTIFTIMGADDALLGYYDPIETVAGISEADFNILLVHEPDLIEDFFNYPIDIALSGHSHGGQVYIPFWGPLFVTALGEEYIRGFYTPDPELDLLLYVNTGLGNTKFPFRLFNIPNVTVFDLYSEV